MPAKDCSQVVPQAYQGAGGTYVNLFTVPWDIKSNVGH